MTSKDLVMVHFGALGFINPAENEQILKDRDKVLKDLTALEIIKKKRVDVSYLCIEIDLDVKDNTQIALTRYNLTVRSKDKLTQEEFDLLKEVLL